MKDFAELALKRQSCRHYTNEAVSKVDIMKCLEAARLAPSSCNSQPWNFVVVTSDDKRGKLAELVQIVGANKFSASVPAMIVLCEEESPNLMPAVLKKWGCKHFAQGDMGAAAAYITLQASDLGLGTCIMGTFNEEDVKNLLDIPSEQTVRTIIALGHPEANSEHPKTRKSIEEIVRFA